ncbi:uncharacterized protein LOC111316384 [Durio zibethinus]|uniref:Uncharacterized protein LOC111316384 n=1 Tax=Durio zibethinus TaxID=66656 RepID=A0A6P6BAG1_DURZI|nr:uncharacterized protein LOC111316384 [Durio zibethinus]
MSPTRFTDNVTEGYLTWRMKRVNKIRPLPTNVSEKLPVPVSVPVLSTLEISQRKFEIEKKRLVGNTTKNFSDMIISWEMIENAIKSGKIEGSKKKTVILRKKEHETHAVTHRNPSHHPFVPYNPYPLTTLPQTKSFNNHTITKYPNNHCPDQVLTFNHLITPLHLQLDHLPDQPTQTLIRGHLVAPTYAKPLKPPYPSWYEPNVKCDYHYGVIRHFTENCTAFKHKVQGLINDGLLSFDTKFKPNVNGNPLPDHIEEKINMVGKKKYVKIKRRTDEVRTPFERSLMNEAIIEFYDEYDENSVNTVGDEHHRKSFMSKPLTVYYDEKPEPLTKKTIPSLRTPITIHVPSPFPYQTNKAVPWRYDYDVVMRGSNMTSNSSSAKNTANIARIGRMTRSGRIYTFEMSERAKKRKGKIGEEEVKESQDSQLVIIKHSEYSVVDQLNKLPVRISLLSLLLNSESYRNALLKVLNQAYVEHNIFVEKVDHMVENIIAPNFITFNDDEIPPEGRGNNTGFDFENLTHISELDNDVDSKDYDLPHDLLKWIEQEKKIIEPHQESTDPLNLGDGDNKKEVRIDTSLSPIEKQKLVNLLQEYIDVFA